MPNTSPDQSPLVSLHDRQKRRTRQYVLLGVFFVALFVPLFLLTRSMEQLQTSAQQFLFPVGFSLLIAGLATMWLGMRTKVISAKADDDKWFFPLLSAILTLIVMCLAYAWVGMWPVGDRSAMIVDLHHQYGPLLAQLRDMILHFENPFYSFEVGLGASFLPLFGYYLSSPFNLLTVLFPENYLTEAILVITLLKMALTAGLFAAAVQYIYQKRSYAIAIAATMYATCAYMLAYSWNIMWLDCLMLLPLAIMGFEKLMREGKYPLYVLSLGLLLYCNYYIGFMCCVFLVLYYLSYVLRAPHTGRELGASFVRFALGSLLGGMLSFVLLIPVVMALGQTSAAGGEFSETATNFPIWSLLTQLFYSTEPTVRSGNLPNLYTGVLAVFLLPVYATTTAIPLRRRLANLGLLGVIALSMTLNNTDLLWHGMHSPNDLPYRYSFLFSLVMAFIAYETLLHIKRLTGKQLAISGAGLAAFLIAEQYIRTTTGGEDEGLSMLSLYVSLVLLVVYALISFCIAHRKTVKQVGYVLLLVIFMVETITNATSVLVMLNNNEYYTAHSNYVDNTVTETIRQSVTVMESLDEAENGEAFYRMEVLPRRTCVDTALFDYAGITVFASSNSYEETRFMGGLGYAVNGVNSHLYHSFNPFADSLLGIKYIASDTELPAPLEEAQTVTHEEYTYHVYRNDRALGIGYVVNNDIRNFSYSYYNPIQTQNELVTAMTGIEQPLFRYQQIESELSAINGTSGFSMSSGTGEFTCRLEQDGTVFLYVDCRAAESIYVSTGSDTDDVDDDQNWTVTPHEPYILHAGNMHAGDTVSVTVNSDMSCSGNVYVAVLDEAVYGQAMNTLAAEQLAVSSSSATAIRGTVSTAEGGVVFTSIPYDKGWTVKVDGKAVQTFAAGEAMLAFGMEAGEHTVEITFFPRGLALGLACTFVGAALLILLCVLQKRFPQQHLPLCEPVPFADLPEEDADTVNENVIEDEDDTPTSLPPVSSTESEAPVINHEEDLP